MGVTRTPVPVLYAGKKYDTVEIDRVNVNAIAEAKSTIDEGDSYRALQAFVSNCVKAVGDITDKQSIKSAIGSAPYRTVEYLVTSILTLGEEDDGIEGVYKCPRCGAEKVCAVLPSGNDTRDHLRELSVQYTDTNIMPPFECDVEIANAQEDDISHVNAFTLEHPTINNCSTAYAQHGDKDTVRLQLAIYLDALLTINGVDATRKWKNRYGMQFLKSLPMNVIMRINEEAGKYGLQTEADKTCIKCGKVFSVTLNTASFFASALRSI